MGNYIFTAERQLMFYVNTNGQQRLVKFGARNANGTSVFSTVLTSTAEAIRKHSLFKRGVIREVVEETVSNKPSAAATGGGPVVQPQDITTAENQAEQVKEDNSQATETAAKEVIEAKNFTQAKSLLAKRLDIKYNDIKTPEQLLQLAKEAGITVKY